MHQFAKFWHGKSIWGFLEKFWGTDCVVVGFRVARSDWFEPESRLFGMSDFSGNMRGMRFLGMNMHAERRIGSKEK